ncbi:MAG: secretin and TonB N-terminal domain-containing protein [Phycisphaerales bacterium]|nr:secretin and TonB N-terminal domain-containing protein [Phycisphaerales bacterium]
MHKISTLDVVGGMFAHKRLPWLIAGLAIGGVMLPASGQAPFNAAATADQPAAAPAPAPTGAAPSAAAATGATGATGAAPAPNAQSKVKMTQHNTVDILVQDEDLGNVLRMLSIESRRNIVAGKDVGGKLTLFLYDVTFEQALNAVLRANGFDYVEQDGFIFVYPAADVEKMKQESRKPVTRVFTLNYLKATDAEQFVTPLLSKSGTIKVNKDSGAFNLPENAPTGNEEFALAATLVVRDFPEHLAEIENLLKELDSRPAQVLVEATILQSTLTEANAFGIDFAILGQVNFTDFLGLGGPLAAASALQSGRLTPPGNRAVGGVSSVGNSAGEGGLKVSVIQDDIGIFIRALDQVTDVNILSNPKILALNRQPARVLVGRKLGYLNTTTTQTSTTQTVQFLDTGTQLAFRPFVSKDGMVRLELKPRVSEGVIRTATDATGAAVTIPDEITQEITTNVIVPDGSTVVLGGLFKETTTLGRNQVPVLGDIPILGAAFRGHDDKTDRQEIIFLVKPTIVNDRIMGDAGDRALAHGERLRTGTRNGLLPWSREKQTAQLNIEAERLADQGKSDEAAHKIRRSLELNPSQPDALKLRERLTGDADRKPERSGLSEIISGEVHGRFGAPAAPAPAPAPEAKTSGHSDAAPAGEAASQPLVSAPISDGSFIPSDRLAAGQAAQPAQTETHAEKLDDGTMAMLAQRLIRMGVAEFVLPPVVVPTQPTITFVNPEGAQ